MNFKAIFYIFLVILFYSFFSSCYYDRKEELYPSSLIGCDTSNISYFADLKTITDNQCATAGCHLGTMPSGIDLSHYEGLKKTALDGTLMPSLRHTGPHPMPKAGLKLDPCTLAKFQNWINQGMKN